MINYDQPDDDPIVAEVRHAREEFAAEFHYDLRAIFREMRCRQTASGDEYATVPPVKPATAKSAKKAG